MPSIINIINTGTSANAGNGDSLRTAFTKVNDNFKRLESSFIAAGVTSFNSQTGVVTFTATDISTILGYTPYSDENPLGFVTSSTISLSNYASLDYVNTGFVSTSTLDSRNYITKEYVDGALTEYTTYLYVDNQGFLTPTTLPNFLTGYVTNTQAGITAQLLRDYTTATIYQSISQSNLIPDRAAFYNIGAEDYTWGNLYLGGATYFSGIGVNVDPITARLYVNGNDILAGWTITPTSFYANDLTVRLSATSRPNAQPGDVPSTAGIVLPSDGDSSFQPLTIINTGTVGVTLQGPGASIELRDRVRVIGEIDTPVTFKGTGIINPASGIGRHSLQITPNASFATPPGYPVPFLTQPQTILSTNTATHAPLLIKGRSIGLYASNSLDLDIGTSGESPGLLAVTPLGVIIGSHGGFGFGDYDELAEFGQNFVLPKTKGATGQVMIQGSGNYLEWTTVGALTGASDRITNGTSDVVLGVDNTLTVPGTIEQNNSWTRLVQPFLNNVTSSSVIWSSIVDYISSVKLVIQLETNEIGDATGWHSQVCEAIIASRGYAQSASGPLGDPSMTVYGVTHTSTVPLATFTVQRNPLTNVIEVVATRTAATNSGISFRIHSVELSTRD